MNHPPRIVPKGPWSTSLDLDLRATFHGEVRTLFRHHVRPPQDQTGLFVHSFALFPRLPLELQHYVLSFCNSATLYRLMHASPSTREEAAKLFWSDPTARYHIHGGGPWLLSGGFVGTTHHNLEALKYMQYILVEFKEQTPILHSEWVDRAPQWIDFPNEELERSYVEQQIINFWATLRSRFPFAKDVVLGTKYLDDSDDEPSTELVQLAEMSPDGIDARVSRFHCDNKDRVRPMTRQLWQPNRFDKNKSSAAWELANPSWTPHFVMPPIQKRSGPVGTWLHWVNDAVENYNYLQYAHGLLFVQAIEAYYLHTLKAPCICPYTKCGQTFEQPGQWAAHYVSSYDRAHGPCNPSAFSPPVMEMLRTALAGLEARLDFISQQLDDRLKEMRDEWGEEGSDRRYLATQECLEKLRDDPLYMRQKAPEESRIWSDYQIAMNDEWHEHQV